MADWPLFLCEGKKESVLLRVLWFLLFRVCLGFRLQVIHFVPMKENFMETSFVRDCERVRIKEIERLRDREIKRN